MPEMTAARALFVRRAAVLADEAVRGRDWGQAIQVNLDTGEARRTHYYTADEGCQAWMIGKRQTEAWALLRRWDRAIAKRERDRERAAARLIKAARKGGD